MTQSRRQILLVAGEASGDLYGARLLEELKELVPGIEAFGLGGDALRAAGLAALADSAEISVIGLGSVLRILPRARQIFSQVLDEVAKRQPKTAVLIDFPEFNLRLAKKLKRRGVRVVYYVSPQLWAWRRWRVKTVAQTVDRMLVLFPFEVDFYERYGIRAIHVGHPLIDQVPDLPQVYDRSPTEDSTYQMALLPGSRVSEVGKLLPVMLGTVRRLMRRFPLRATVIRASTIPLAMLEQQVRRAELPVQIVGPDPETRYKSISDSHIALCASGTATLEVGLLATPLIVLYRLGMVSSLAARLLIRLSSISMVNLVLGRQVVPELIQSDASPKRVAEEVERLLLDRVRIEGIRAQLATLRERLGEAGASARAAREVADILQSSQSSGDAEG